MVTMVMKKINKKFKISASEWLPLSVCFLKLGDNVPEQGCYMPKPKWSVQKAKRTHLFLLNLSLSKAIKVSSILFSFDKSKMYLP